MTEVILYTRKQCPLCDEAKELLEDLQHEHSFTLVEKDIYEDDDLLEKYQLMIPVVEIAGEEVDYGQINTFLVRKRLHQLNV